MTRRERHLRILESFGEDRVHFEFRHSGTKELLSLLSDEGVAIITRRIVSDYKRQQKYNAENRARIAKAKVSA